MTRRDTHKAIRYHQQNGKCFWCDKPLHHGGVEGSFIPPKAFKGVYYQNTILIHPKCDGKYQVNIEMIKRFKRVTGYVWINHERYYEFYV